MRSLSIEENNRLFARLFAALPAVTGSLVSILLVLSSIWAVISLLMRRFPLRYVPTDRFIVVPALIYVAVMAVSVVAHARSMPDLLFAAPPALFAVTAVLIPRYRAAPWPGGSGDYFELFLRTAPLCGLLVLPVVLVQAFVLGERVDGFAGNPYPFAMICAVFGPASLIGVRRRGAGGGILAVAGLLAALIGVVTAEARTAWVAFAINLVILAWYFGPNAFARGPNRRTTAAVALVMAVVLAGLSGYIVKRTELIISDVRIAMSGGIPGETLSARMAMWHAASGAIAERPLFGYGPQNRKAIIEAITIVNRPSGEEGAKDARPAATAPRTALSYNHFHNGFLTAGVDAGVFGILATVLLLTSPLVFALASPRDGRRRDRLAFAGCLVSTYLVTGSFNIMFGQDLIDTIFVLGCLMLALSVGGPETASAAAGEGAR